MCYTPPLHWKGSGPEGVTCQGLDLSYENCPKLITAASERRWPFFQCHCGFYPSRKAMNKAWAALFKYSRQPINQIQHESHRLIIYYNLCLLNFYKNK